MITNLTPDTLYPFTVHETPSSSPLYNSSYKTLPNPNIPTTDNVIVYFGGDLTADDVGNMIVGGISKVDADIILVGGDLAYENANPHCYYSWDLFLNVFEAEFKKLSRIVPFIFSVGNHDVGYVSSANLNVTMTDEKAPFYFTFFPQAYGFENNKTGVPAVADRRSYINSSHY